MVTMMKMMGDRVVELMEAYTINGLDGNSRNPGGR